VQVYYQLKGEAGQIAPPRTWTIADEVGTEGVDTHALTFDLLPNVPADAVQRYTIYADAGTRAGNPPDYLVTPQGKRLEPADLLPAVATTAAANGSIAGTTFEDVNADGMYGAGDKPVGGVTVFVDLDRDGRIGRNEQSQVSDPDDGTYLFPTLRPGTYQVREVTPSGYVSQLAVPAEGFHLVPVAAGRRVRFVDFGHLRPGTVSGVVFNDLNGNGIRERAEVGGVAGATLYVDLNRNGAQDPGESADVSTAPAGAWTLGGLAPGTYVIRQLPPDGYAQTAPASFSVVTLSGSGDSVTGVTFGDQAVGPRVTGVFLAGSTWTQEFRDALGIAGLGFDGFGYLIKPAEQFRALPWSGLDRISIRFDSPIRTDPRLTLTGLNVRDYQTTRLSYVQDGPAAFVTWAVSPRPVNDRLTIGLNDLGLGAVTGRNGVPLDGEWVDGADAYPSGDRAAGGHFAFTVNVLGGDATGDGVVNALDLGQIKARLNRSTSNPGSGNSRYSVFADVTADGRINALDLGAAKLRLNQRLPRPPLQVPVIVAGPPVLAASVTREVFSQEPVL
jgi:hypothetical protein